LPSIAQHRLCQFGSCRRVALYSESEQRQPRYTVHKALQRPRVLASSIFSPAGGHLLIRARQPLSIAPSLHCKVCSSRRLVGRTSTGRPRADNRTISYLQRLSRRQAPLYMLCYLASKRKAAHTEFPLAGRVEIPSWIEPATLPTLTDSEPESAENYMAIARMNMGRGPTPTCESRKESRHRTSKPAR